MSLTDQLRQLLTEYRERFPEEASVVDRFGEFADSGEPLHGKSNHLRHITASSWTVSPNRQRVLLTHHAKLNIWVQLGGHTDVGEDWSAASLREATEESGLKSVRLVAPSLFDLDIHLIPARSDAAAHEHYDMRFLVEADDTQPLRVSSESRALAWVEIEGLEAYTTEESQLRMRKKTQS